MSIGPVSPSPRVTVRWLPPLDRLLGKVGHLDLETPVRLDEFLRRLAAAHPGLSGHAPLGRTDRIPMGVLAWRAGRLLNAADLVSPDEELEILVMVEGG